MSYIGNEGEQSTSSEVIALTNLTALAESGVGQFLRKTGLLTFENASLGELTSLTDLSDVLISEPLSGQFLYYNGSSWVNYTAEISGTVTSVSVVSANGVSGVVANETTTPAITLTLGVITPTSVNGLTLTAAANGFTIAGGTTSKTLTVALDASVSGTNTGDQNLSGYELLSNKATTFGTINDTLYPTVKAVNDAITTAVIGLLDYRGVYDASTNLFPATGGSGTAGAVLKGDFWMCSVAGTLGGVAVAVGDLIIALVDTPAQTAGNWDLVEHDLGYAPLNKAGDTMTGNLLFTDNTLDIGASGATRPRTLYLGTSIITPAVLASANDSGAIGASGTAFADLFLASGGVVNWNAGNATLTHSAGLLTSNVPLSLGTSNALTCGSIELGAAADTTITRTGAGAIAVEGVAVLLSGGALGTPSSGTLTSCTGLPVSGITASTSTALGVGSIELGHASDTTIARVSAGVVSIEGVNILTVAGGTLTGNITFGENTALIHDNALSADGKYTGDVIAGTAGATLAFGDLCYLDPTDSRWELCDANSASAADGDSRGILGICVLAAAGDASATTMLLRGFVRADTAFPTFTINAPSYVSETAGDITETKPTTTDAVIRVVGFGFDANTLYFNPASNYITPV